MTQIALTDKNGTILSMREVSSAKEIEARANAAGKKASEQIDDQLKAIEATRVPTVKAAEDQIKNQKIYVPEGQTVVEVPAKSVWEVGGKIVGKKYTAPPPPSIEPKDHPLNRIQFETLLILIGLTMADIEGAIDEMKLEPMARANTIARLRNSQTFHFDSPTLQSVAANVPTETSLADLWMQASKV